MSKRRPVSDEDAALFRNAVGNVRALDDDRTPVYRRRHRPHPKPVAKEIEARDRDRTAGESRTERDSAQLFVRPGLQQKHVRRLRRGQMAIEAEADLHGMRIREARTMLNAFLRECRDEGLRCVRVIHGKGRGSRGGHAVLKWEVDGWLRQDDAVLAFCTAQPRHGGSGALYVLLKR